VEVLEVAAEGLSCVDIGERLYITVPTVNTHLRNIYRKLKVRGRSQAISVARRDGLI
jgi:DNA-binding CsgD family transcriptional regulator